MRTFGLLVMAPNSSARMQGRIFFPLFACAVLMLILIAPLGQNWLIAYAQVVNHLAQGARYDVIVDPEEFRTDYMAAYEAEDPNEPPAPGLIRLHNYGLPDFASIQPPHRDGAKLVFFAENITLGIPYRAEADASGGVSYEPVDMGG